MTEVVKISKKTAVEALVKKFNVSDTTKELVSRVMDDQKMSQSGARTYVYNARQALGLKPKEKPIKAVAAKKSTETKASAAPKTETPAEPIA